MKLITYISTVIILVGGMLASFYAYTKIVDYERSENIEVLNRAAEKVTKEFQDYLSRRESTLRYMKAYFYAYGALGIEEFDLFATSVLLFEPDIDNLFFALDVPLENEKLYRNLFKEEHGKDSRYPYESDIGAFYPVHYVKSYKVNDIRPGKNLLSIDGAHALIENVFETGATGIVLAPKRDNSYGDSYLIAPLFSIEKQTEQINNNYNVDKYYANHGFVGLSINIDNYFYSRKNKQPYAFLDIEISTDKTVLGSNGRTVDKDLKANHNFEMFGKSWSISYSAKSDIYQSQLWQKYFVLYGGFALSTLVALYFYLFSWQKHQDRISKKKLSEEIFKKEKLNLQMQEYTDKLELARLQQMEIYRSLQEEKLKAEQANKTKSDFLANMSHELRTPLNSIIGITKIIKEDYNGSKENLELIGVMQSASEALLEIVNDILDLSKIEAGKIKLERTDFDVQEVIQNVVNTLQTVSRRKSLYLRCEFLRDDIPVLIGDPLRISRIFMNLLSNAVKYTEQGGVAVQVDFDDLDDGRFLMRVKVIDTGIGIDKEKLDQIFDKFTQEDETTTRNFGGTGLGLTITRDLLAMMKGNISVSSVKGKGSVFSFEIPLERSELDNAMIVDSKPREKKTKRALTKEAMKNMRVLLVEDNEFNIVLINKFLKKMGFEHIDKASNGQEGIDQFNNNKFDLILMDCHMPIKSGYEATEEIREIELETNSGTRVPIIALTADAMVGVRERCLEAGMDDYLSKPVDFDDLMRAIQNLLTVECDSQEEQSSTDIIGHVSNVKEVKSDLIDFDSLSLIIETNEEGKNLYRAFEETAEKDIDSLQACIEQENWDQWKESAHSIKGSAAMLRLTSLARLCAEAQEIESTSNAVREIMLERIKNVYAKSQKEFEAFLESYSESA